MFTRMTGDLVKRCAPARSRSSRRSTACAPAPAPSWRWPPTCASAPRAARRAFLFNRVGLAGCDMGACAMLPRIIGQGRASELLYTGRSLGGEEGERWGFFNRLCAPEALLAEAQALARELAAGPTFANGITKTMLHQEWAMTHRAGDRGRGAGAGDVHADRGFRPRLRRLRRQAAGRCSRATEHAPMSERLPRLAVLRAATASWRASSSAGRASTCAHDHGTDVDADCRALVRALGEAGWLRHAVAGTPRRRGRGDRHPRDLPDPRDAGAPLRAWPISPSRCRAWARARSAWPARRAEGR